MAPTMPETFDDRTLGRGEVVLLEHRAGELDAEHRLPLTHHPRREVRRRLLLPQLVDELIEDQLLARVGVDPRQAIELPVAVQNPEARAVSQLGYDQGHGAVRDLGRVERRADGA
jgi:hypothetical protein